MNNLKMNCIKCSDFLQNKCDGFVHYGDNEDCNDEDCKGHDIAVCNNKECCVILNCSDIDNNGICRYCGLDSGYKTVNGKLVRIPNNEWTLPSESDKIS